MITVDLRDPRPIYEQIIERVKLLILKGIMLPGSPLPSVRSLAMELSINPNTIQRAYQELERIGYIYSVKGKGSFVSDPEELRKEQQQTLLNEFKDVIDKMYEAGYSGEQLIQIIKEKSHD